MIPLAVPNLGPLEREYVAQALASGWVGPAGPFVERFEAMVAKAAGRSWAIATITGSAALHAAAFGAGFSFRHVNVPRHAFPAMRNVLAALNAKIKMVDPSIAVTYGGRNHDFLQYSIPSGPEPFVCDRAPAIGEPPKGPTLDCYSFAANKIVTGGHGGAITGDNPATEMSLRSIINQGYGRSGVFNYRMANLNAALGCAQMDRLHELKAAKNRIWKRYEDAGFPMIERGPSRWMATVDLPHSIVDQLKCVGIESRAEPSGGVSLPSSTGMTEAEQEEVIRACESWFRQADEPTERHSVPSSTP
jgi:dTDP-4-amino-4,6-dideoxygalactose transaminase